MGESYLNAPPSLGTFELWGGTEFSSGPVTHLFFFSLSFHEQTSGPEQGDTI